MLALLVTTLLAAVSQDDGSGVAWIRVIPYEESTGELRRLYDVVKGASGNVDNVVKVHSLRPHTLEGHYTLYKSVLHHPDIQTPAVFLEALGVYRLDEKECRKPPSRSDFLRGLASLALSPPRHRRIAPSHRGCATPSPPRAVS